MFRYFFTAFKAKFQILNVDRIDDLLVCLTIINVAHAFSEGCFGAIASIYKD